MNIKTLKEYLQDVPDDFQVCLSNAVAFGEKEEAYEVILDFPIVGIAVNEEDSELRFIVSGDTAEISNNFGTVTLIEEWKTNQ